MKKNYLIILCGLFIALQTVLKKLTAIDLGFVVIDLDFIAIALGGAILGPLWNGLICAATDVVSFILFPGRDPFFPGFTLSALLKGLAYGFFLKSALPFLNDTGKLPDKHPDKTRAPEPARARGPISTTRSLLIRTTLGAFCVTILIEAFLNTLWVAMLYNKAYMFYLGSRLVKSLIMLPAHVALFGAIWRPLGKYIETAVMPKVAK
jgi:ECF transporter S component (folate family)